MNARGSERYSRQSDSESMSSDDTHIASTSVIDGMNKSQFKVVLEFSNIFAVLKGARPNPEVVLTFWASAGVPPTSPPQTTPNAFFTKGICNKIAPLNFPVFWVLGGARSNLRVLLTVWVSGGAPPTSPPKKTQNALFTKEICSKIAPLNFPVFGVLGGARSQPRVSQAQASQGLMIISSVMKPENQSK